MAVTADVVAHGPYNGWCRVQGIPVRWQDCPGCVALVGPDSFNAPRTCELAGVTYRQLDYWIRTGLVTPSLADAHGSGTRRRFSRRDVQIVAVLGHAEIAPTIRPYLAAALRPVDPLPPWIVLVGDWTVKVCTTRDELDAAIVAQRTGVIRVVFVEGLVDFDA